MIYGIRRMIYLLRKHDIISVPLMRGSVYHPQSGSHTARYIIRFRRERISLKKETRCKSIGFLFSWCARGESKPMNQVRKCEDFLGVSGLVGGVRRPFADLLLETKVSKYYCLITSLNEELKHILYRDHIVNFFRISCTTSITTRKNTNNLARSVINHR